MYVCMQDDEVKNRYTNTDGPTGASAQEGNKHVQHRTPPGLGCVQRCKRACSFYEHKAAATAASGLAVCAVKRPLTPLSPLPLIPLCPVLCVDDAAPLPSLSQFRHLFINHQVHHHLTIHILCVCIYRVSFSFTYKVVITPSISIPQEYLIELIRIWFQFWTMSGYKMTYLYIPRINRQKYDSWTLLTHTSDVL